MALKIDAGGDQKHTILLEWPKYGHNDRIVFTQQRSNFLHKIIKLKTSLIFHI